MDITEKELRFICWYRRLNSVEKIAVRCLIKTGDDHLVAVLRKHGKLLNCPSDLLESQSHDQIPFTIREVG